MRTRTSEGARRARTRLLLRYELDMPLEDLLVGPLEDLLEGLSGDLGLDGVLVTLRVERKGSELFARAVSLRAI